MLKALFQTVKLPILDIDIASNYTCFNLSFQRKKDTLCNKLLYLVKFVGFAVGQCCALNFLSIIKVGESEQDKVEGFWQANSYVAGSYDQDADFKNLDAQLLAISSSANRLFYLALPPSVYHNVTAHIKGSCMTKG